jgi:hypothetical protein
MIFCALLFTVIAAFPVFASRLATPRKDDSCKILRHCERSEAIHAGTLDCFTAFAMTVSGFPYAMHKTTTREV